VKSTPMRGVKETLKPNAYKQWEGARPSEDRDQGSGIRSVCTDLLCILI
jgi:hypothetical protein